MNEREVQRVLTAADPYRGFDVAAATALLTEIIAQPRPAEADVNGPVAANLAGDDEPTAPVVVSPLRGRDSRQRLRTVIVALAVAAAVAVAVVVPIAIKASRSVTPADLPEVPARLFDIYTAPAIEWARTGPLLLATGGEWHPISATTANLERPAGTVVFRLGPDRTTTLPSTEDDTTEGTANGATRLSLRWYQVGDFDDMSSLSPWSGTEPGESEAVLWGRRALVSLAWDGPAEPSWVEVELITPDGTYLDMTVHQIGGPEDTAVERALTILGQMRHVDVETWLAAMPGLRVNKEQIAKRITRDLAELPAPVGFFGPDLVTRIEVDAMVPHYNQDAVDEPLVRRLSCAWIGEWRHGASAGEGVARQEAAERLRTVARWKRLDRILDGTELRDTLLGYADDMAAGREPEGYADELGC